MPDNLNTLLKNIKNCTLCASNLPFDPRPVFQIHPKAKILIAGQAPGKRVHETGVPFDDPSGNRLREWLGIDKGTFYNREKIAILPMGFCYPGTGKSGDLPPRPECAEKWREEMLDKLTNVKLTLVVGQYAMAYHLKESKTKSLTKIVKDWKSYWPDILPLPHPSPRNNIWLKKNPWFEKEILPALRRKAAALLQ